MRFPQFRFWISEASTIWTVRPSMNALTRKPSQCSMWAASHGTLSKKGSSLTYRCGCGWFLMSVLHNVSSRWITSEYRNVHNDSKRMTEWLLTNSNPNWIAGVRWFTSGGEQLQNTTGPKRNHRRSWSPTCPLAVKYLLIFLGHRLFSVSSFASSSMPSLLRSYASRRAFITLAWKEGRKAEGRKEGRKEERKEKGRKEERKKGRKEERKKGRKERTNEGRYEGRKEGRKEERKDWRKEGRMEGRKEGTCLFDNTICED